MPKNTRKRKQTPVVSEVPSTQTPEPTPEPTPTPAPANAENRKKLLTQLGHHSKFVKAMGWTLGILGLYFLGTTLYALSQSVLLKPVWSLIAGTSTSPGIPVAVAQAILPAFMAPYAVYVVVGVPLALWGYQFAFEYLNKPLFDPKVVRQPQPDTPANDETPDNQAENKPKAKKTAAEAGNKSKVTKPAAEGENKSAQSQAKKKAASKSDPKKSTPARPAADKGHGKVISHAFDQHKLKAQETKQKAAQTKKAETANKAVPAKRKTTNRR